MIRDGAMQVSTAQLLTTTGVSTDSIDLSSANTAGHLTAVVGANPNSIGTGRGVFLLVEVVVTLAAGTNITFEIITATDAALTTAIEIVGRSDLYVAAALTAGREPIMVAMNPDPADSAGHDQRYLGVRYTIVGTFTSGSVNAGFLLDYQDARIFPASTSS